MLSTAALALALVGLSDPTPAEIRAAAEKAIPRIEASLAEYSRQRDCFACHHHGVGLIALTTAGARGLKIDADLIREQAEVTAADLNSSLDAYRKGQGQGGGATRAGYALWALDVAGYPPDETTAAVAGFLLGRDRDGWQTASRRPPTESSPFTTTYVALRALNRYAGPDREAKLAERLVKAREWLLATPAEDTESRVFRLRALKLAGADADAIQSAAADLLKSQGESGGWRQNDDLAPDAYATATALVALQDAGALTTEAPTYRRGLAFLIRDQQPDGTWQVTSRSRPFQAYFESGFPYGKDQFISMSATCWAVTALSLALPPQVSRQSPLP